jgi:hypothetical protein
MCRPLKARQGLWFFHDGAPAHFNKFLNQLLKGCWTKFPPTQPEIACAAAPYTVLEQKQAVQEKKMPKYT